MLSRIPILVQLRMLLENLHSTNNYGINPDKLFVNSTSFLEKWNVTMKHITGIDYTKEFGYSIIGDWKSFDYDCQIMPLLPFSMYYMLFTNPRKRYEKYAILIQTYHLDVEDEENDGRPPLAIICTHSKPDWAYVFWPHILSHLKSREEDGEFVLRNDQMVILLPGIDKKSLQDEEPSPPLVIPVKEDTEEPEGE